LGTGHPTKRFCKRARHFPIAAVAELLSFLNFSNLSPKAMQSSTSDMTATSWTQFYEHSQKLVDCHYGLISDLNVAIIEQRPSMGFLATGVTQEPEVQVLKAGVLYFVLDRRQEGIERSLTTP
jgi:hypothetical protein